MKVESKAHFRRKLKTESFDKIFSKLYKICTSRIYDLN